MTTEERLMNEAEEYFKSVCEDYNEEFERTGKRHYFVGFDIKNAYIASAEPREKQLEEKDKKIAELEGESRAKENCWNCAYFKEKKYQACVDIKKNNTIRCAFYKWEGEKC